MRAIILGQSQYDFSYSNWGSGIILEESLDAFVMWGGFRVWG